jgi:hypothetical protein
VADGRKGLGMVLVALLRQIAEGDEREVKGKDDYYTRILYTLDCLAGPTWAVGLSDATGCSDNLSEHETKDLYV